MTLRSIARFYKDVGVSALDTGWTVLLDGKGIKTPGRAALTLPTSPLAEAIAEEWRRQTGTIDPVRMPLTGLAYAAIDLVRRHRGQVIEHSLGFGRSDLLCYRAEGEQRELAARQAAAWDPLLDWIAETSGIRLQTAAGVVFVVQPPGAPVAMEKLASRLSDFALAAFDRAVSLAGSFVLGVALLEGRLSAAGVFAAAHVDEEFQAEKWGRDAEAEKRRRHIRDELHAAERFLRLLDS